LVASNEQDFIDAVLKAYTSSRRDVPDQHLLRRAALSAEFALAQYLVKALAAGDRDMVSEAEDMLESLASDIAEYGGQPISIEPLPAKGSPEGPGTPAPAAAGTSAAAPASGSGSSLAAPAVTVVPVPAQSAGQAQAAVPGQLAGQAEPQAPVQPAVHVTPIPVDQPDQPAAGDDTVPATDADIKGPDDTSTAAISVINAKQG